MDHSEKNFFSRKPLSSCVLCPHRCRVNRLAGETGLCGVGSDALVASFGPHFGEEAPLVGRHGSGTIFFSGCNLHCVFCQNHDISHIRPEDDLEAQRVDGQQLAGIMLHLQSLGCHNINLVTPSHVVVQIREAIRIARCEGLQIPVVYNSSGYDRVASLRLLAGLVDIYMPDCKFSTSMSSSRYTNSRNYPEVMKKAIKEMHRQVGDLDIAPDGLARHGLLVRHLVMPGLLDETREIMTFLAREISPNTYVNIMDQYRPCHRATEFPEINRSLRPEEYRQALRIARDAGLVRFDQRDWRNLLHRLGM